MRPAPGVRLLSVVQALNASVAAPASSHRHGPLRLLARPRWLAAGTLYCAGWYLESR
jgi:hypothetical protein